MLSAIRAFAKSWVAAVLIGLLIVSFAIFGIRDVFHARTSNAVITAGSRTVSGDEFRRAFEDARKQAEQRMGQPITTEFAAANGFDRQVLEGLAVREAFAGLLQKIGIVPSDRLVATEIAKIPAFQNPVTGRFDKQQYVQRLAQNELTTDQFEKSLRDEMAEQHMIAAIANGLQLPRAYAAMAAVYTLESRDVSYILVDPASVPQPAAPTDAQLAEFMKAHAAQLTQPEFRVLTVVRFSPQLVAAAVKIDEAEVRKRYDFRKDTLGAPETRTIVQIPAKTPAAAQAIIQRLANGEAPAAVARSQGVDAITYENKPKTAIPDHKLADAAFQMTAGQVSQVQGDIGPAVVKVVSVTPGKTVSLEEARPAIEAELRKDAAADKVYALTQAYEDAHDKGANLMEAAQKAGVPATTVGPVSKGATDQQGQQVAGLDQKLLDTAFGLPAGGESDVVEAGNGEYFAVRVEKIIPPAMPPLAQIRPELARAWVFDQVNKALLAKADTLAARVRKGESLDAVAASSGTHVVHAPGLDRQTGEQNQLVSQDILGAAFSGKPGDVFTARARTFGYAVGKVDAIHAGDPAQLAQATAQARGQMAEGYFREIGESAQQAARIKMKVQIDAARARAAIGLPPLAAPGKPEPAK
jgi:peptidyl-prolyl cis-trans isomerase D